MWPGMIPTLACPGVMTPGQFGPMSRLFAPPTKCLARTMSATGMPSVMQITSGTPAAAASMMASAAAAGGTKMSAQLAPSLATASATVFHTANPSCVVPPLPGVTPPTTWVPYSLHRAAWKAPSRPVIPCTTTRVDLSTRTGILSAPGLLGEGHGLLRAVCHVGRHRERQAGVRQHLLALLDVRPLRAQHDRQLEPELLHRADDALRQPIHAEDATEDVDEHRLHTRIRGQDAERVLDLLGRGAAADVEKVRRLATGELDDVHGGHGQTGPVHHAADVAVELYIVEAVLRRLDVERILLVDVAQLGDLLVPVEGVVVEVELRVQREHPAVLRDHQRVDLHQRAVLGEIDGEEIADERHRLLELLAGQAETEREPARLEVAEPQRRMGPLAQDLVRRPRRHLLDVHAARRGRHHHVRGAGPVERDREVELALDRGGFFHEDLADLDALRRRLRRLQHHAEDLAGRLLGGSRGVGELDAAALAAPARVHLRLHDHLAAEPLRDLTRRARSVGDIAPGHRHAELAQQRLRLVLVDLHDFFWPRNFRRRATIGSMSSATRSFSGMMPLSVMWMCSGQTSVQHLVMLHRPTPPTSLTHARRSSRVSSGCMSRPAALMKKRGPAKAFLFSSWSRMTWQTSWQRKHSMHLWNSWMRSMSSCIIRWVPSASGGLGRSGGSCRAFS